VSKSYILSRVSYRQFMWGLSNGVLVLTVAGGFWLGILGSIGRRPELAGTIALLGVALLLWGFVHLRRKSAGFSLSEMKNGTEAQRLSLQRIRRGFRWVSVLELVLVSIAVGSCEYFHRVDLMWPALGIAVSAHFAPLVNLFRVRLYYFTAAIGILGCSIGLVAFASPMNTIFTSSIMCLNMWGTAAWLIVRSEAIAQSAIDASNAAGVS
jgi:hypothetical protein